jgi:hypothetical protein
MEQAPKVKMIKQDALIKIEIGTGFLKKLQHLLLHITQDLTPEQLENYKKVIEQGGEFTEEWMDSLNTISFLLKEIEAKADEQGFIFEMNIDDLPSSIAEEETTPKEN